MLEWFKSKQTSGWYKKALENGVVFGAKAKLSIEQINLMRLKRTSGVLIKDLMKDSVYQKRVFIVYLHDDVI